MRATFVRVSYIVLGMQDHTTTTFRIERFPKVDVVSDTVTGRKIFFVK